MNENEMQDTALRNLLTQKLESDDMKMFIDSLNASKDDDSAIQELKKSYEAYISNESLSTGDIVSWKTGMRNRTLPNYRQPAIVIEKLQYPIFDESQNAGSQYFHEPLDLRVGFLDDNNQFVIYFYDSRRFEKYRGSLSELERYLALLKNKETHEEQKKTDYITKGQQGKELADIRGMYEAGIPAISEDGRSVMNSELYREAMEIAAELDIPVLAHCEDINLVNGGVMNEDAHSKELGLRGITNSVEDIIVARDIMLSGDTGAKLHLCHCSTRDSVKMVRYAKMEQMKVTAEVCPHHFTLTSDDIHKIEPSIDQEKKLAIDADADTNFKMNPPLRSREDVQALKEGLRDNIMDVISTDHAPHTFEEKNTSMKKAPFGIVGLETAACLTYTELVLQGYLTPMQMAEKMSYNPAKIVGIDKGDIQPGKIADIVIFDPEKTYKIDKTKFASKGRNTPFDGREVTGKVMATIVDGRVVYEAEA